MRGPGRRRRRDRRRRHGERGGPTGCSPTASRKVRARGPRIPNVFARAIGLPNKPDRRRPVRCSTAFATGRRRQPGRRGTAGHLHRRRPARCGDRRRRGIIPRSRQELDTRALWRVGRARRSLRYDRRQSQAARSSCSRRQAPSTTSSTRSWPTATRGRSSASTAASDPKRRSTAAWTLCT